MLPSKDCPECSRTTPHFSNLSHALRGWNGIRIERNIFTLWYIASVPLYLDSAPSRCFCKPENVVETWCNCHRTRCNCPTGIQHHRKGGRSQVTSSHFKRIQTWHQRDVINTSDCKLDTELCRRWPSLGRDWAPVEKWAHAEWHPGLTWSYCAII